MQTRTIGEFPNYTLEVYGTAAEIEAYKPGTHFATGFPSDTKSRYAYDNGVWTIDSGDALGLTLRQGGVALQSRLPVFDPSRRVRVGTRAVKQLCGRVKKINIAAQATWQLILTSEQHFDAVTLGLETVDTTATDYYTVVYMNVMPRANMTNAEIDALPGWLFAGWAENDGSAIHAKFTTFATALTAHRQMYSNPTTLASVPRDDGAPFPIVVLRGSVVPLSGAANPTVVGDTALLDNVNHGIRPDGRVQWVQYKAGNGMTSMVGGTDRGDCCIASVIFWCRGRVVNVVKFGDSVDNGRSTYQGDSFIRPATIAKNLSLRQIVYECSDQAWSGSSSTSSYYSALQYMNDSANPPIDVLWINGASPNDIASGASAATVKAALVLARLRLTQLLDAAKTKGIVCVTETIPPCNTTTKDWTLCDGERIAHNSIIMGMRDTGVLVLDRHTPLSGATVGGQVQLLPGTHIDGIHLSTYGEYLVSVGVSEILAWIHPQ